MFVRLLPPGIQTTDTTIMAKTGGGLVAIRTLFADSALARSFTPGADQYQDPSIGTGSAEVRASDRPV